MVILDGKEVMVADIATAKTGKHGAAKTFVSYIDPSTGVKKDKVISGNDVVEVVTTSYGLNAYFKKSIDDLIRG